MEVGQLFDGKYKILKLLGQGGMGKVYLAENIKLGTLWAVKQIYRRADVKVDLLAEPNILKRLSHPALPKIFDIIEDEENIYVIVDYIEGVSLDKKLKSECRFAEEKVAGWAKQICEVLHYLHTCKPNPIIYRDMKPSNIILTDSGNLKLIDFGIAREYKTDSGSDTVYIGTKGYAAPEQYGTGQTNVTTDIYGLGVTLYHLITGKSPGEPPYEIKPVRYFDRNISEDMEFIILKCSKQNPEERYQSVDEILRDLESIEKKKRIREEPGTGNFNSGNCGSCPPDRFKKLILTVWDNAEFGCEIAYIAARLTGFRVLLGDLDLFAPKADLHLNVGKYPEKIICEGMHNNSGLNIVMDALEKNYFSDEILINAAVQRKELKNLYILTGNYKLDNYEYYSNDSLERLIDKAYRSFDITILLVNKSIYDSYTVMSLIKSDYNVVALHADVDKLREFNSYLMFLKEKQQLSPDKTKFVAFEYSEEANLSRSALNEITEGSFIGSVRYSCKRARYRNIRAAYVRRMDKMSINDYIAILSEFNIVPGQTSIKKFLDWAVGLLRTVRIKCIRRVGGNAGNNYAS